MEVIELLDSSDDDDDELRGVNKADHEEDVFMIILHPNKISELRVTLPRKNNSTFSALRHVIEDELDHLPPFEFLVNGEFIVQPKQEKKWNFGKFGVKGTGRWSSPFYIYLRKRDMMFEYTGDGCSVPKDITSVRFKEGLQKIGNYAFRDCTSLESIKLPSTLVEIGEYAFYGCNNLRKVILNEGLKKIGHVAFRDCTSLESITLPSTLIEIGSWAFRSCSNLSEVTLNDGLQKIGDAVFYFCSSLQKITIASTIVEIGDSAFGYCSNLREVKMTRVPQCLKTNAFHSCDALDKILFPTISYRLENIIQTSHWEDFEDKVNEVRGVVQWESNKLFLSRGRYNHWSDCRHWNDARRDLGRITRLVSYYERKEATSTFELALWKSKLDQANATNTTNRAAYRIDVPGPVKATILQYLDKGKARPSI